MIHLASVLFGYLATREATVNIIHFCFYGTLFGQNPEKHIQCICIKKLSLKVAPDGKTVNGIIIFKF